MSSYRNLTPQQRYRQAVRFAQRQHTRALRDFMAGRTDLLAQSGMDREKQAIVREIGRAYEAGRAAERARLRGMLRSAVSALEVLEHPDEWGVLRTINREIEGSQL